jgi:LacI family transcriptional regulator
MTINDIAKLCGVSKGTVNRALHGKPGINSATKERILAMVKEKEFRPDYRARSLATGKTYTIGLLIPNVENQCFSMIGTIIEADFWKRGYFLTLAISNDDADKEERYLSLFVDRKVDGLVLFPVSRDTTALERVLAAGIPTVLILNDLPEVQTNAVTVNEYGAIQGIVNYLVGLGHRNIAYIDGYRRYSKKYNDYVNKERFRAFSDTLAAYSIPFGEQNYVEFLPEYYQQGDARVVSRVFRGSDPATAVVCFHDRIAIWLQTRLIREGLKVPEDVSITGFDDIDELSDVIPGITTVRNPFARIAEAAVKILIDEIKQGRSTRKKLELETSLVIRQSCAARNVD